MAPRSIASCAQGKSGEAGPVVRPPPLAPRYSLSPGVFLNIGARAGAAESPPHNAPARF